MKRSVFVGTVLLILLLQSTCLCATENAWTSKTPMANARTGVGIATVDGKIYAIGGVGEKGFCTITEEYNPAEDVWITRASIPSSRSHFGVAVYQNKIYCIGGQYLNNSNRLNHCARTNEVYDPSTDSWKTLAPMPTPQLCIDANVVSGKIYVIGGHGNIITNDTVNQVYDPAANTWTTKAPLPTGVDSYASTAVGDKIYVFSDGLTQIYDAHSDSWQTGTPAPFPIISASAVAAKGSDASKRIYVFGATEHSYPESSTKKFITQCYNPVTDDWTNCTSMLTGRHDAAAANVDDVLYTIGGFTTETVDGYYSYVISAANEQFTIPIYGQIKKTESPQDTNGYFYHSTTGLALIITILIVATVLFVINKERRTR